MNGSLVKHSITWFVWAGGEKIRHTNSMRGEWGYDAQCSCGWATYTGGAVKSDIKDSVNSHKFDVRIEAE